MIVEARVILPGLQFGYFNLFDVQHGPLLSWLKISLRTFLLINPKAKKELSVKQDLTKERISPTTPGSSPAAFRKRLREFQGTQ
jgi:hypothetical protein